ncbi:MAG: hemolysin III family protein [Rhodospirillales bacterium]|nr:hemolysin III family protein [Rhodospirillales bacterium]
MTSVVDSKVFGTLAEETASAAIQAVGTVISVFGLVVIIDLAIPYGALSVASVSVYGGTLVLAFLASALYHGVRHVQAKHILRTIDHCAIYLLIAGTYTPVALLLLGDHSGMALMATVWGLAVTGIILRIVSPRRLLKLQTGLYLVLGWLILAWSRPVFGSLGFSGTGLFAAGGLAYSSGVIFYLWNRLPFNQAVWHLFVITGSACFFAAIAFYILPVHAV